jgi:catechol 2,3-dioxygenase-like lactoylglutathione lyase family enzyme
MIVRVAVVTILVADQEDALAFYTEKLGFQKHSDEWFGEALRWLTVAPPGQPELQIYLALPFSEDQQACVGKNPTWSFATDDCQEDYERMKAAGVVFTQPPIARPWGVEAVFRDLYGNTFSLNQPPEGGEA